MAQNDSSQTQSLPLTQHRPEEDNLHQTVESFHWRVQTSFTCAKLTNTVDLFI